MTTRQEKARTSLPSRFWSKVDKTGSDECWIWTGALDPKTGYGRISTTFTHDTASSLAHRVSYELCVGPIPEGKTLDHLCRTPACVNPGHLDPVTHRENVRRGASPSAANARKTHCHRGHPFDEENTAVYGGKRSCRECRRQRERRKSAGATVAQNIYRAVAETTVVPPEGRLL